MKRGMGWVELWCIGGLMIMCFGLGYAAAGFGCRANGPGCHETPTKERP